MNRRLFLAILTGCIAVLLPMSPLPLYGEDSWQVDARVEWPVRTVDVVKRGGQGTVAIQGGLLRNEGWGANGSLLIVGHWSRSHVSNLRLFKSPAAFERLVDVPLLEGTKNDDNPLVQWTEKFITAALAFAKPVKVQDSAIGGHAPGQIFINLIELVIDDTLYQIRFDQVNAGQEPKLADLMNSFCFWKQAYGAEVVDESVLDREHIARLPVKKPAASATPRNRQKKAR